MPDNPFPQLIKEEVKDLRSDLKVSSLLLKGIGNLLGSAFKPRAEEQEQRFVEETAETGRRLATYTDENIAAFLARREREL